jgi:hypothetical protein
MHSGPTTIAHSESLIGVGIFVPSSPQGHLLGQSRWTDAPKSQCSSRSFLMGDGGWYQSCGLTDTRVSLDLLSLKEKHDCFVLGDLLLIGKLV